MAHETLARQAGFTVENLDNTILHNFKCYVEEYSSMLRNEGIEVVPYEGLFPKHFLLLNQARQRLVFDAFARNVDVCRQVRASGFQIKDDRQLLWFMIKTLNWHPTGDILKHIEEDDLVEIYTSDGIQIFRNAKLFPHCSYNLDDLLSRPWWDLFRRDESITETILRMTGDLFSGRNPSTQIYPLGPFYLQEVDSARLYRCLVKNKVMSPLKDKNGRPVALITVARILSCESMRVH